MGYVDWEFAKTTGRKLVAAGPAVTREEAVAEVEAIRAAAAAAREPVAETARLRTPDDAPDALVVDRATWIAVNADSMSAMLDPTFEEIIAKRGGGESATPNATVAAVGAKVTGAEAGALLAFMASKVLGQYDLAPGGKPGVISAHYAGEVAAAGEREARRRVQDAANNARLLDALRGTTDRRAHFICTLVAVRHAQDPQPLVAVGRWPGEILAAPRGTQGFGYDPLMFIPELGRTVAELDETTKNRHSHRARATAQMRLLLQEVWHL